jgi:hypothetical protein
VLYFRVAYTCVCFIRWIVGCFDVVFEIEALQSIFYFTCGHNHLFFFFFFFNDSSDYLRWLQGMPGANGLPLTPGYSLYDINSHQRGFCPNNSRRKYEGSRRFEPGSGVAGLVSNEGLDEGLD